MRKLIIKNSAFINDKETTVNGKRQLVFRAEDTADQKLEAVYRSLDVSYPKFFKMDAQAKLGWLCAEYVAQGGNGWGSVDKKDVALVLSNNKASLDTDENYQQSLNNPEEFLPSPSVFVYTLANIVAGEICIRHGIKGENNFLISERFDAETLYNYVNILFAEGLCTLCLVGWVEAYRGSLRAVFALVKEGEDGSLFSTNNLNQLYQTSES